MDDVIYIIIYAISLLIYFFFYNQRKIFHLKEEIELVEEMIKVKKLKIETLEEMLEIQRQINCINKSNAFNRRVRL